MKNIMKSIIIMLFLSVLLVFTVCDSGSDNSEKGLIDTGSPCVNKINELRATKGLPPFQRYTEKETCADGQATSDENALTAHKNFGSCGEFAQNETMGGTIETGINNMWAEKDQPGCSGCDNAWDGGELNTECPDCDFYGYDTGDVCGHYVNMISTVYTKVACGQSTVGDWAVIDFFE